MVKYYLIYKDSVSEINEGDKPDPRDVQIVVQPHPDVGWHMQAGNDYYVWREDQGRWVGVDIFGLFDFLLDTGLVLFGRTLLTRDFNDAMRRATEIRNVAREKTGWLSTEKRP